MEYELIKRFKSLNQSILIKLVSSGFVHIFRATKSLSVNLKHDEARFSKF